MNKATPAPESAEPLKFKNAALLNRLFEMTKAPYYATACDTLVLAEMAIVGLERENAALRAEFERLAAQAEPAPAPVGEYPAKALEVVEPVACLVETERGVMVWPIADLGEASTYCDEGEFPEPLYSATTVSALRERIAELESELRRVTTSPPTGGAPCARLCEHMAFQIQAKSDARRIAELEALLQEAGRTIDNLTVFAGRSGQSIQVRASIDAARKESK